MRAVEVSALGGPEVLRVVERPDPVPGEGQLLVRVRAATVNPADLAARTGQIPGGPVPPPFLIGWDVAGEVVGGDAGIPLGTDVVGLIPWHLSRGAIGAYAELVAVDAGWVVPLPDGLDPVAAATVPLNGLTAHRALDLLDVKTPTTVLVTGASGGVGGFAAQLALRRGHTVLACATHDDEEWVRGLGVHSVIPRGAGLDRAVPAVLDAVPLGGIKGDVVVATRPLPDQDHKLVLVEPDREALSGLVAALADGTLRTRVSETFPLEAAAEAHRRLESGGVRGKLVLTL
ncbi:NADPH:quinone reductase [Paractinoplanes deccanensis]|uniref:NADPH:quinone reductase n=1 Tax=Paractinoplanes deccanensis TaxID=113561 RepID=A0ABQ3YHA8_9ACTN|nr:NADP-dependent oxidoreductase [Actinoplanes deccanensis]GID79382.1 NADPH:quinone reductase [Actinoplanes deccanensis]